MIKDMLRAEIQRHINRQNRMEKVYVVLGVDKQDKEKIISVGSGTDTVPICFYDLKEAKIVFDIAKREAAKEGLKAKLVVFESRREVTELE